MTDTTEGRLRGERPKATPASPREGAEAAAGLAVTGAASAPAADVQAIAQRLSKLEEMLHAFLQSKTEQ